MTPIRYEDLAAAIAEVLAGEGRKDDDGLTASGWKDVLERARVGGKSQWSIQKTRQWIAQGIRDKAIREGVRRATTLIGNKQFTQTVYYLVEKPDGKATTRRAQASHRGSAR